MATVTLSTQGNFVSGTTGMYDGQTLVRVGSDTDTVVFPLAAPVGFKVWVNQDGAGTVTLSAASGATIVGNTSLATDNHTVMVFKNTTTEWVAAVYE